MRAIILAAGRGSRMGEATASQPKCMTQFEGKSLLAWQVDALRRGGVEEIALATGYCADRLEADAREMGVETFFCNERWAQTNMVSSLACASQWLRASPCLVSYSDILYTSQTIAALCSNESDLAISYDDNWLELWSARFDDPLSDAETFRRKTDGTLESIGARAQSVKEIEGQYMGLLRFSPAGWAMVERLLIAMEGRDVDRMDMTSLLQRMLASGCEIATVARLGPWGEVDSLSDLRVYEQLAANGRFDLLSA